MSLQLCLGELPLVDCKKFWGSKEHQVADTEKIKFIAVTGGIPKYLEEMNPKLTTDENIRRLAFTEGGILFNDFTDVFTDTLLRKTEWYERIMRLLSDGAVDSKEVSRKLDIPKGSYLSDLMDELITAGFVSKHSSWDLKTGKISTISQFRLSDNYLRFYLKYITPHIENTSVRPVLIYLGDIHDEVIDADYFTRTINVATLMENNHV